MSVEEVIRKTSLSTAPRTVSWQKKPCASEVQQQGETVEHPSQFQLANWHVGNLPWNDRDLWVPQPALSLPCTRRCLPQDKLYFPSGLFSTAIHGNLPCQKNRVTSCMTQFSWREAPWEAEARASRAPAHPLGISLPWRLAELQCFTLGNTTKLQAHHFTWNPFTVPLRPGTKAHRVTQVGRIFRRSPRPLSLFKDQKIHLLYFCNSCRS